jgi:hypothetical protein
MFRRRYFAPAPTPEPKPVSQLTRPQICGRIAALRGAIDALFGCSDLDGGEAIDCLGSMKKSLYWHEERLREMDRQTPAPVVPLAAAVNHPDAVARLEAVQDQIRAMNRGAR